MYILLNWDILENITPVMDENETTIIFHSTKEANTYAKENLYFKYQIVKIKNKKEIKNGKKNYCNKKSNWW
jgi:hypothetical protein